MHNHRDHSNRREETLKISFINFTNQWSLIAGLAPAPKGQNLGLVAKYSFTLYSFYKPEAEARSVK
jgi:hypothetical protein